MKTYEVKIEGMFFRVNFEESRTLCGVIAMHVVAANSAIGAVTRAKLSMLDQLAERKVDRISDGPLKSFGFISGVWELKEHSASWAPKDPGLVFYKVSRLKIPWLLMEKFYFAFKKPHRLLSF